MEDQPKPKPPHSALGHRAHPAHIQLSPPSDGRSSGDKDKDDTTTTTANRTNASSSSSVTHRTSRVARESHVCPQNVACLLEGIPLYGSQTSLGGESKSKSDKETRKGLKWFYYTALAIMFVGTIVCIAASFCFEFRAYRADAEWNRIVLGKAKFKLRRNTSGQRYFHSKKLKELTEIFPPNFNWTNPTRRRMKVTSDRYFYKEQRLEISTLVIFGVCGALAIVHCGAFLAFSKVRKKLKMTFILYGMIGVAMIAGTMVLACSVVIEIPFIFVEMRLQLEDYVWDMKNYFDHHEGHKTIGEGHENHNLTNHTHTHPTCNVKGLKFANCVCDVHRDVSASFGEAKMTILLNMMKMCAYRHMHMNWKDPCYSNPIPKKLGILGKDGVIYKVTAKDLEQLTMCPNDGQKLISMILGVVATIWAWLAMWLGSHALHHLFPVHDHYYDDSVMPTPVSAMEDFAPRGDNEMPSEMRIPSPGRTSGGAGGWFRKSPSPLSTPSASVQQSSTLGKRLGSYLKGIDIFSRKTPPAETTKQTVMTLAPHMVIHPPAPSTAPTPSRVSTTRVSGPDSRANTAAGTTPTGTGNSTAFSWFRDDKQ